MNARLHYAFLFLAALAQVYGTKDWLSLQAFSMQTGFVPQGYLEEIACTLRKAGIIKARRGVHGGYQLLHTPSAINLYDVVVALEVSIPLCGGMSCARHGCQLKKIWQRLQEGVDAELRSMTLQDLIVL